MNTRAQSTGGFTLFEALIAVALMGLILGVLATLTAQWLPNWHRGLAQVQRNEQVAVALDRLVADLSAAEYVSLNRASQPSFDGGPLSVIFVRTAIGPNTRPGLEIVRIAETADGAGRTLVRTRAPFAPTEPGNVVLDRLPFRDPVVLLRAPLGVTFAYAGRDGIWLDAWRGSSELPRAVRFLVRDMVRERPLAVSTATAIHVGMQMPEPEPDPSEQ
ncbi:MAG TPA: hypothetical protein VNR11_05900 [Xanthobacteraceae bacterium]|nr:hypothetical protein [Xanthobacteraceae bacterium]